MLIAPTKQIILINRFNFQQNSVYKNTR